MRLKYILVGLAIAAVCAGSTVGAVASTKKQQAKPPIHLALIALRLPGSDLLTFFQRGATVAQNQINKAGGFGGRKLIIDACNSQLQPAAATACAHATLAKHPVASFGCELAWSASGLPLFAAAHVPSLNCLNDSHDYNNPWSFGLVGGTIAQTGASMRWLCSNPAVHKVSVVSPDFPLYHTVTQPHIQQIAEACGKTTSGVFYPLTAVDVTPFVQQTVSQKPDFVIFQGIGAQAVQFFKTYGQNGIPADHIIAPDTDFSGDLIAQAGGAMEGGYIAAQFGPWGAANDPAVKAYTAAFKAAHQDGRDATTMWGYADVMFIYNAAKKIGFAKFNGNTLQHFLNVSGGFPIPLARTIVAPGPHGYRQVRQPYSRIAQWKNGKFNIPPVGPKKDGWVYGY
jgi:branched-chain amino acid transport system substrate-binding protein